MPSEEQADNSAQLTAAARDLDRWLRAAGVPYAIIGGMALSIHAVPRFTRDVDAITTMDIEDVERVAGMAARHGIAFRVDGGLEFARRNLILLLVHEPTGVWIDLSIGLTPFEQSAVDRAFETGSRSLCIARVEDLLVMKTFADRPQDRADVERLVQANPRFDRADVRKSLRMLADLVEEPEVRERLTAAFPDPPHRKR